MANAQENSRRIELALLASRQKLRKADAVTFRLSCFCAKEDKAYTLCFTKQPSGLFRFTESIRTVPQKSDRPSRNYGYMPPVTTLRLDLLEPTVWPCAWCGNGSFHYCGRDCKAFVCGGLMQGNTFHCRKSCGAIWVGQPLESVEGQTERHDRMRAMQNPPISSPSNPSTVDRLRLGAGGDITKK